MISATAMKPPRESVAAFVSFGVGSRSKNWDLRFLSVFHKQAFSDLCLLALIFASSETDLPSSSGEANLLLI